MKKRKAGRGKRGATTITIVRAFGIAMAAFVIVVLIQYWRGIKDDTFLEKNYMARDIALLLTAAYASPGELTYCYYITPPLFNYCYSLKRSPPPETTAEQISYCEKVVGDYKGKFDFLIENSMVTVVDSGRPFVDGGGAVYYYADSKSSLVSMVITSEDARALVLQIVKDASGVKVLYKKVGEDAKPCEP